MENIILGKRDKEKIKRSSEHAKNISSLVKITNDMYGDLHSFWDTNFGHTDFDESVERFQKYDMYDDVRKDMALVGQRMAELKTLHDDIFFIA